MIFLEMFHKTAQFYIWWEITLIGKRTQLCSRAHALHVKGVRFNPCLLQLKVLRWQVMWQTQENCCQSENGVLVWIGQPSDWVQSHSKHDTVLSIRANKATFYHPSHTSSLVLSSLTTSSSLESFLITGQILFVQLDILGDWTCDLTQAKHVFHHCAMALSLPYHTVDQQILSLYGSSEIC